MQGQGAPDILGVGCGDILFFQVKPSFSYFFEGVLSGCSLLLANLITVFLWIYPYCNQLSGFDLEKARSRDKRPSPY